MINKYYDVVIKMNKSTVELIKYLDEINSQQWITVVSISEEEEKDEEVWKNYLLNFQSPTN